MENVLLLMTVALASLIGVGTGALVLRAMLALTARALRAAPVSASRDRADPAA